MDAGCEHIRFEQVNGAWNEMAKMKEGAERINLGFSGDWSPPQLRRGPAECGAAASREVLRLVTESHLGCIVRARRAPRKNTQQRCEGGLLEGGACV